MKQSLRSALFAALYTSLLPLSALAADRVCAPPALMKAVVTIDAPDLPADHFYRVPKTFYRAGERQGRIEEALNPATGIHLLIVVNEPDVWMANLAQGQGRYLRDPGPTFYFRARLFNHNPTSPALIPNLEIGCELAWLRDAGAKQEKTKHPTLGAVNKWELAEGPERVVLFERDAKPLRVELFRENQWVMAMNYLSYETNLAPRPSLFAKPANVTFE